MGANVVGLGRRPDSQPSLFEAAQVGRGLVSVIGDVRDQGQVHDVFQAHEPEFVFHLAAQPLVRRSFREPVETFSTNLMGTVHLLEAARRCPSVRAIVVATSDKCYDNREWIWGYRESDPLGGHDPYSASKGCAELATSAYRRSFFSGPSSAAVASGRAGNVVGGGDWAEDRLVPDIVRSLSRNELVVLRRPRAVRPWQHVLEPLRGYLMLAARLCEDPSRFADGWNFGPDSQAIVPVADFADRIISQWGSGRCVIQEDPQGLHEATLLALDCSKARQVLGWRPLLSLEETVAMTADWYRDFYRAPGCAPRLLERQIESYEQRIDAQQLATSGAAA